MSLVLRTRIHKVRLMNEKYVWALQFLTKFAPGKENLPDLMVKAINHGSLIHNRQLNKLLNLQEIEKEIQIDQQQRLIVKTIHVKLRAMVEPRHEIHREVITANKYWSYQ